MTMTMTSTRKTRPTCSSVSVLLLTLATSAGIACKDDAAKDPATGRDAASGGSSSDAGGAGRDVASATGVDAAAVDAPTTRTDAGPGDTGASVALCVFPDAGPDTTPARPEAGAADAGAADTAPRPEAGTPEAGAADARPTGDGGVTLPAILCDPPLDTAAKDDPTRERFCALDIGSRTVRVVVSSRNPMDRLSHANDRFCRTQLNLGESTINPAAPMMTGFPLPAAKQAELVALANRYNEICKADKGKMLGAIATEWARRVANPDEVKAAFKAMTGIELNILSGEQEALYGYTAGSYDQPNRMTLDFGSRSFQLAHYLKGDATPTGVSYPWGSENAGDRFFSNTAACMSYAAARNSYAAQLRRDAAATLTKLKDLIKEGKLEKEIFSVGDSALILAARGYLLDASGKWLDPMAYELKRLEGIPTPPMSSGLERRVMKRAEVEAFTQKLIDMPAWIRELQAAPIRATYGNKILAGFALLSFLFEELDLASVTFSPLELADGFMLEQLRK